MRALGWLGAALLSCKGGELNFVRTPQAGRTDTCPRGVGAVDDRFGHDPNAARCSYADAIGDGVTTLSGRVRADDGGLGVAVEGVVVTLHRARPGADPRPQGPTLGDATTDPQGGFRFSAILEAGEYVLVVSDAAEGRTLAYQRLTLQPALRREIEDVLVLLPIDERLGEPGAEPPVSSPSPAR